MGMMSERKFVRALVTGSFDPVTVGHVDLIRRAAAIFDEVHVVIFFNTEKGAGMFPPEVRLSLLRAATESIPNVITGLSFGLVADYVTEHNINVIVRGVRGPAEYEYEMMLSEINKKLTGGRVDIVVFPASPEFGHVSSSFARDMVKYGRPELALTKETIAELERLGGHKTFVEKGKANI